jgi:hypothetical protein
MHQMRDRPFAKRDALDVALSIFSRFGNRLGDFVRFAEANTNVSAAIANGDDRVKTKAASAFDNLRYTIYGNEFVFKIQF